MDPYITVLLAFEKFRDNDLDECVNHILDYQDWRANKGFVPDVFSNKYLAELIHRSLNRKYVRVLDVDTAMECLYQIAKSLMAHADEARRHV